MDALFFWFFSIIMLVSGLAVILNRNPVASLLCFVASIACMSGLFVMLSAYFLAVIELLVTAGAVMVLFLFVIMLINITEAEHIPRRKVWMGASLFLALGFLYIVAKTLNASPQGFVTENSLPPAGLVQESSDNTSAVAPTTDPDGQTENTSLPENSSAPDDTHQIGKLLFTTYVAPFEVTSLLILVATVGVIVLCKQDEPRRPAPREAINREAPPIEPKKEPALTR
jgi:NADH-quinone oxidoreductase subunit J